MVRHNKTILCQIRQTSPVWILKQTKVQKRGKFLKNYLKHDNGLFDISVDFFEEILGYVAKLYSQEV